MTRQHKPTQTIGLIAFGVLVLLAGCRAPDPKAIYADGNHYGVCPIHHRPMTFARVPLNHGYYVGPGDGPSSKVWQTQFRFAQWHLMSGSPIISGEPPKDWEATYLCSRCENAKLAWIAKNPDRQWSKEQLADYRHLQEFKRTHPTHSARSN